MDADETKAMALRALGELREAALHDGGTWVRPGGDRNVGDACAMLERQIRSPSAPNPAYASMGEAAASLVLLAATDPEAYARLVGPILGKNTADVRTMWGLVFLANFLSAIGDDHDYSLDRSGPAPVVRHEHEVPVFAGLISPQQLVEALRPMLDAPSAGAPRR